MTQFNSLDVYAESGRKQAIAVNQHDASRAKFEKEWRQKALALETPEYAKMARKAADEAYSAARTGVGGLHLFLK